MGDDTLRYEKLFSKTRFAVIVPFYTDKASNGKLCHHDIADSPVDKPVTLAVTHSNKCSGAGVYGVKSSLSPSLTKAISGSVIPPAGAGPGRWGNTQGQGSNIEQMFDRCNPYPYGRVVPSPTKANGGRTGARGKGQFSTRFLSRRGKNPRRRGGVLCGWAV